MDLGLFSAAKKGCSCVTHSVMEDIPHASGGCLCHNVIRSFVSTAFLGPQMGHINNVKTSLSQPVGLIFWVGVCTHWNLRCQFKGDSAGQGGPPSLNQALSLWRASLHEWSQVANPGIPHKSVTAFTDGIEMSLGSGMFNLITPQTQSTRTGKRRRAGGTAKHLHCPVPASFNCCQTFYLNT